MIQEFLKGIPILLSLLLPLLSLILPLLVLSPVLVPPGYFLFPPPLFYLAHQSLLQHLQLLTVVMLLLLVPNHLIAQFLLFLFALLPFLLLSLLYNQHLGIQELDSLVIGVYTVLDP